jgi:hypothetical protein
MESKNLTLASDLVLRMCEEYPKDAAVIALAQRIAEARVAQPTADSAIWHLPGK